MFENPRRGRQARNFTTNVPKILGSQIVFRTDTFRKLTLGAPDLTQVPVVVQQQVHYKEGFRFSRTDTCTNYKVVYAKIQWRHINYSDLFTDRNLLLRSKRLIRKTGILPCGTKFLRLLLCERFLNEKYGGRFHAFLLFVRA